MTESPVNPIRPARSFRDAREAARAFTGASLVNEAHEVSAVVSEANLAKMLSGKAVSKSTSGRDHALAVANLDQLFPRAREYERRPDHAGEPTIVAMRRFACLMRTTDDRVLEVRMLVKETASSVQPNPLYTVEVRSPR